MKVSSADAFESKYPSTRSDEFTANCSLSPLVYIPFEIVTLSTISSRASKVDKMPGLPFNETVGDTIPPDTSQVSRKFHSLESEQWLIDI